MDEHPRHTAEMAIIKLPTPPSANELFIAFSRGGKSARAKSKKYVEWLSVAGARLEQQRPPHVAGPYEMKISLTAGARGDVSNRIKAIEDLCVAHHVVIDDRYAERVEIYRGVEDETIVFIKSTGAK